MARIMILPCLLSCLGLADNQDKKEAAESLLKEAADALKMGNVTTALQLASGAIAVHPKHVPAFLFRAAVFDRQDKYADAAADYGRAIVLSPKLAEPYFRRGLVHFKMGKFAASIADFDKQIELEPKAKISHWQRGITYYYAGRFDAGRKQFEGYQDFDDSDVENAVWRYLCMARKDGVAKARAGILKVGPDTRVPMKEIYELFAGRLKPADVLAAASAGKPAKDKFPRQLFYAHLYLGLYYETEGHPKLALQHLTRAATDFRIGHYMWDVARVHRDVLRDRLKKEK